VPLVQALHHCPVGSARCCCVHDIACDCGLWAFPGGQWRQTQRLKQHSPVLLHSRPIRQLPCSDCHTCVPAVTSAAAARMSERRLWELAHKQDAQDSGSAAAQPKPRSACADESAAVKAARVRQALLVLMVSCWLYRERRGGLAARSFLSWCVCVGRGGKLCSQHAVRGFVACAKSMGWGYGDACGDYSRVL
jgi:hypothetical protein